MMDFFGLAKPSDNRCSSWSRLAALDPIGSIGSYEGYLLVEWPMPWPRDVATIPALSGIDALVGHHGLRLQLVMPALGEPEDRICLYWKNAVNEPTGFTLYEGRASGYETMLEAVEHAISQRQKSGASFKDILICGHGARDRCCGSMGTRLALWAGHHLSSDVRVWRTSHTGGHRFAPTATILPEGTAWAFVEGDILGRLVRREGQMDDVIGHYRGCSALGSPSLQALEREALRVLGWSLFDAARFGQLNDGKTTLIVRTVEGKEHSWEALVSPIHRVALPRCGDRPSSDDKVEVEYEITNLFHW
jgi:hypothetical protein